MVMLKGEGKKNARSPLMGHAPKVPAGRRRRRRPARSARCLRQSEIDVSQFLTVLGGGRP